MRIARIVRGSHVDNDSRLFLDAQEAKKVSELTVDR